MLCEACSCSLPTEAMDRNAEWKKLEPRGVQVREYLRPTIDGELPSRRRLQWTCTTRPDSVQHIVEFENRFKVTKFQTYIYVNDISLLAACLERWSKSLHLMVCDMPKEECMYRIPLLPLIPRLYSGNQQLTVFVTRNERTHTSWYANQQYEYICKNIE